MTGMEVSAFTNRLVVSFTAFSCAPVQNRRDVARWTLFKLLDLCPVGDLDLELVVGQLRILDYALDGHGDLNAFDGPLDDDL